MNIYLACAIIAIIYLVWRNGKLSAAVTLLSAQTEQTTPTAKQQSQGVDKLGYEWYDASWPYDEKKENEQREIKYENPTPFQILDLYTNGLLLAEYKSASSSIEKKIVLRRIRNSGVRVPIEIADLAFSDDSPVRAWAAAHLDLVHKDYTNWKTHEDFRDAPIIRNFEKLAHTDPDPVVRASFYSNPDFEKLPWNMFNVVENWQELVASTSQIERLALMRNPDLQYRFLVALMRETSEKLNMTRDEHRRMICAGAINPRIVDGSRETGRNSWFGFDGDAFPPFDEYAQMWQLALDSWKSDHIVPYYVFKYVQTTFEAKMDAYNKLLSKPDRDSNRLREEILLSCDLFNDGAVLAAALKDPDEKCRKLADERLGEHKSRFLKRTKK